MGHNLQSRKAGEAAGIRHRALEELWDGRKTIDSINAVVSPRSINSEAENGDYRVIQ